MENEEILFAPEEPVNENESSERWKILIVDDEQDVHQITKIALSDFRYHEKKIEFLDTYSAQETEAVLQDNPDVAIVLLDVVMESVHAGLDLVRTIRSKLNNSIIRIILRTGQAGQAPEKEVIREYEIDDYKTKTELTNTRLFTVVLAALRNYETLRKLETYSEGLEKLVEKRTKEITDSIRYASYIQTAIFPPLEMITSVFPEHFIFSKPRDIVSGDFYWLFKRDSKVFFCLADCTGHGVPGAFMSLLGISYLNEIINNNKYIPANEILNELRSCIIRSLNQSHTQGGQKDGMDISFCILDLNSKLLQFSGGNNAAYILPAETDYKEIVELKADRMPIGIHENMEPFTNQNYNIKKGDVLYLFSDGFKDQFGGPDRKKFMAKRFRELLLSVAGKPITIQKEMLNEAFEEWKGESEQIDDVTIWGIKF